MIIRFFLLYGYVVVGVPLQLFLLGDFVVNDNNEVKKGFWFAVICYGIWGMFPLYWYPLNALSISAEQVMAHRVLWSAVFAFVLLLCCRQFKGVLSILKRPKSLLVFMISSFFIGVNWLIYLWAIKNHHVLDASLGYFINPLVNILLGYLFFKERLGVLQFIAVGLALVGVMWLAVPAGGIPWVSLLLAFSFSGYALIRKRVEVDALTGLAVETFLLLPFAIVYLLVCIYQQNFDWSRIPYLAQGVLIGSGVATALPLLFFTASARRISLSLLGILQYISPSLQLVLGLMLFGEVLDGNRLVGYMWVWLGVLVFLYATWNNRTKYT